MPFHSGHIAIIGRPNVGKSTLVNLLLEQKIAAVSPRAQTTRRRQLGILTDENSQMIFVDTPGIHSPHHKLGEYLNQEADEALQEVDIIFWIVDASSAPNADENGIAARIANLRKRPTLLLGLNKIDLIQADMLTVRTEAYQALAPHAALIAFSATHQDGREAILNALRAHLPEREPEFPEEQITDYFEKDIAANLIREACLNILREEVPHGVDIRVDEFTERGSEGAFIAATLFVERESHKGIVIGEGGAMLKKIGSTARAEIESMSGRKVFLQLRVKVSKDWRDDENVLTRFGYKIKTKKKKK